MCTVSWVHEADGYHLLCNRDEKLSRRPASAPGIEKRDGVVFVAPIDGDFGGTWIASNEFGLSVCLLNGPPGQTRTPPARSRGLLLPELLSAGSSLDVSERVWSLDLSPYAPFLLAVLEPSQSATLIGWDGWEKSIVPYGEPYMPLVSSSFDLNGARERRRSDFLHLADAAGKVDRSVLFAFHESHGRGPDAYSPCMHRADAATVSFSWVSVTEAAIEFFYTPAPPCRCLPAVRTTLERRQ